MDRSTLVSIDLSEGAEVVSALENGGIHLQVALWMVTAQYEDGRLILASEDLPQSEILKDYEKVVAILQGKFFRSLPLFSILRMDDPLIQELRRRFANTRSVQGMRLGGQIIGNKYIEDAYVYKIE